MYMTYIDPTIDTIDIFSNSLSLYDMYWVIPSCITINNHSHQHWTILWASMGSRHYLDGP